MAFEIINYHIRGLAPLIPHNGRLSDPLDEYAKAIKEISGKKKKSDQDYEDMARLEYLGGLYLNQDKIPVITAECIEGLVRSGAKKTKQGQVALAAIFAAEDSFPIIYTGPKDPEKLWAKGALFSNRSSVKIGQVRVMRTRPMFRKWELKFSLSVLTDVVSPREVSEWVETAGRLCGLCDWRPKYGRFEVLK